jgi:hypothetical protein
MTDGGDGGHDSCIIAYIFIELKFQGRNVLIGFVYNPPGILGQLNPFFCRTCIHNILIVSFLVILTLTCWLNPCVGSETETGARIYHNYFKKTNKFYRCISPHEYLPNVWTQLEPNVFSNLTSGNAYWLWSYKWSLQNLWRWQWNGTSRALFGPNYNRIDIKQLIETIFIPKIGTLYMIWQTYKTGSSSLLRLLCGC